MNNVYPALEIAEQPDVVARNVKAKGEHAELDRIRPRGVPLRFEQYCCVPVGHEPFVKKITRSSTWPPVQTSLYSNPLEHPEVQDAGVGT